MTKYSKDQLKNDPVYWLRALAEQTPGDWQPAAFNAIADLIEKQRKEIRDLKEQQQDWINAFNSIEKIAKTRSAT